MKNEKKQKEKQITCEIINNYKISIPTSGNNFLKSVRCKVNFPWPFSITCILTMSLMVY